MLLLRNFSLLLMSLLLENVTSEDAWWLKVAQRQGPMVCAEELVEGNKRHFSTPWTGGNLCGTETIIRYSCCHGYSRVPGERGCPLVEPLKNIAETAKDIGATKFIEYAEQSGLLPMLTDRGAYTVFVARDKAFRSLTKEQEKALNSTKKSRSRPPILLYTIVEGRLPVEELPDSITTLYREGSVAVTRFPSGLTTVNCIPLISTNLEATNGLLHVTETLLLPPGRSTVTDLLARTQSLSTTAAIMARAQLSNELRDRKPITVFAPVDEAWESVPQTFMESLMEDPNALKVLLQYHIVEAQWCSAVTANESELKTLEGSFLRMSCNSSGQYVNNARIIHGDDKAGNGFVHHIDSVLIPDKVQTLVEYLSSRSMTYFLKLAEFGGVLPLLQRPDMFTIFVPTDDAFEALPNDTLSDIFNQSSLARSFASFHITPGRQLTSNLIDGQTLSTIQGSDFPLRFKLHKKRITVETALVIEADLEARNGVLQVIDNVLIPPTSTILDHLQQKNFSIFLSLLNHTDPNLLQLLDNSTATFTVLAPNDIALNDTPPGTLLRLLSDPPLLYQTMARHILPTFVVSSTLEPHLTYSYETVNEEMITVTKENGGFLTVARLAEVIMPDLAAKNGVIHEISRLIQF
ncbi:transforming growth factor-beta-induced protein ig-h3-like isoform X1 [Stegodyphus dumicola]|uniref:transforming growth factor-beta-induced protein ig-h3-like isoform X1 n=1 Tax=Stegodyphus dumicola TaxID=202533 RepID=UPI0015ADB62B|nr:transforming growth factor-beta-induced protein ig-h3-like isoform X1 [Stegodyphus dumicola]